eukprot:GEMP01055810.1.p3 GENE.GEMP01055810.1~~GEMP01055810.1.p3  ORF type:complete len:154 (+),score=52.49 GEMP01055810.1:290-751(+)
MLYIYMWGGYETSAHGTFLQQLFDTAFAVGEKVTQTIAGSACSSTSKRASFDDDLWETPTTPQAAQSARRSDDGGDIIPGQEGDDDEGTIAGQDSGKRLTKAERRKVKVAQRTKKEQDRIERKRQKGREAAQVQRVVDSGGSPRTAGLQVVVV